MSMTTNSEPVRSVRAAKGLAVCVQGLGFVGAANAIAIAGACGPDGQPLHRVVGVDLPTTSGCERAAAINRGEFPYATTDADLVLLAQRVHAAGNLSAVTDPRVFADADVIVVDVGLDLETKGASPTLALPSFEAAIRAVGDAMRPDALVLLESTVPPGTSEEIVAPLLRERLSKRGLPTDKLKLAYCYERVMPGNAYLASIVDMWRVYAGLTHEAADEAEAFLASFIDVGRKPLRRLANLRSAEMAKTLENTYRAVNIALIDEWERFARRIDVDLFQVLEAIRVRPTHNNIRFPGLGVGGYCLSKDPLFGLAAEREIYKLDDINFTISVESVHINDRMPINTVELLRERLHGLEGRRVLILGASYRQDVGDTRLSPSITLATALLSHGTDVTLADPLVESLDDHGFDGKLLRDLPSAAAFDAVVFAVAHAQYRELDVLAWLGSAKPLVCDSNGVLAPDLLDRLAASKIPTAAIGRGRDA